MNLLPTRTNRIGKIVEFLTETGELEMGMDIYGRAPRANCGEYFRMTDPAWHPLWDYCEFVAPDIIPDENLGHFNEGWGLDRDAAKRLAQQLQATIDNGECHLYKADHDVAINALPDVECASCSGTGIEKPFALSRRVCEDFGGSDFGGSEGGRQPIATDGDTLYFSGGGNCTSCKGTGRQRHWNADSRFEVDTVEEFIEFLLHCGGFKIW